MEERRCTLVRNNEYSDFTTTYVPTESSMHLCIVFGVILFLVLHAWVIYA